MPRLLIATTVPDTLVGFLLPFAEHFRSQGWRVDGMARGASTRPECVKAFDRLWDIPWSRNPLSPRHFWSTPRQVREIVAREGYDLVHVHTPVAAFVTRMALRHMRVQGKPRVIYTAHGFHFYEGGPRLRGLVYRTLEKWAGNWTDYLVVINREDERAAVRHGVMPPERVRYMPGIGVDLDHFNSSAVSQADVERLNQELKLGKADPVFLMLAEFNPRKRHCDTLAAFARLRCPEARLLLAGTGPLQDKMRKLAGRLGIADRVRFLGLRRDVPVLIKRSTAMVLPSLQEGLPRSVMESMSQGVPVIGSRIRGMTDLLEGGRGLLAPVGDVNAFADAMAWVLDHPAEARAIGERARDSMGTYDLRQVITMHEELYDEALMSSACSLATMGK